MEKCIDKSEFSQIFESASLHFNQICSNFSWNIQSIIILTSSNTILETVLIKRFLQFYSLYFDFLSDVQFSHFNRVKRGIYIYIYIFHAEMTMNKILHYCIQNNIWYAFVYEISAQAWPRGKNFHWAALLIWDTKYCDILACINVCRNGISMG